MAALKIAREAGQHDPDNVDDAIGYLSLIEEVRSGIEAETLQQNMPYPPKA